MEITECPHLTGPPLPPLLSGPGPKPTGTLLATITTVIIVRGECYSSTSASITLESL